MNRRTFNQYVSESNFRELFISEMGWNNPPGATSLPEYTIDKCVFRIDQIAERNGFQILQCEVKDIPTSAVCKKLDTLIRRNAENYICIFIQKGTSHHLWAVPVKKVEKRDIVLVEYLNAEAAGFLFEKIEGLSFGLDERTTITDVVERVHAAFIINSEKVTKDFYTGFKKEHTNFAKFISGIDDQIADKDNRNKQWYTSVMLNRLMFCYFIQKKGFLDGDVDYLRHKLEWTQQEKGENRFFSSFYKGFLTTLFHGGLNAPKHDRDFENVYGRIPYLNGGMFDVHQIEQDYAELDIADDAFISLFDFFDKWHWHLDDRLTATGKDINPDVLGYIFEQYINDRAQMGAYYTKEDITEYIGRNTIVPYLMDATRKRDEKPFKPNGEVWASLKQSGDSYIFDAVKKGKGMEIPEEVAIGLDTQQPNLLERRKHWNDRTPEAFALPTEIWRETIERLQRYNSIKAKIENGEITSINDFITFNLDIRQFVYDLLNHTNDHLLVKHFYAELQKVTILDPTCGSGAFLFAALNILEPLYEVCISRMQEFHAENPNLFKDELQEIEHKYRSNIQYFIYKSIILRNLYGVDIMVEATEIAKLRLFLKMVAVVEVNKREANLGLDPLPDIDFNIRCGNTLVGYATEAELERDLDYGDMFARQEFEEKVHDEMDKVARTFSVFKDIQLKQAEDMTYFKRAKAELKARLNALNDLLNRHLYAATVDEHTPFENWLASHQPFHWLAEFYEIINGNGGFDVIIGNPPYVEISKAIKNYKLKSYSTISCGNLYACVYERSENITRSNSFIGMIVQLPIACTDRMSQAQKLLLQKNSWFLTFDDRPGKLFDDLQHIRATIFLTTGSNKNVFTTKYNRWYSECRCNVFKSIATVPLEMVENINSIPKVGDGIARRILYKITNFKPLSVNYSPSNDNQVYTHNAPQYFTRATNYIPYFWNEVNGDKLSVSLKAYSFLKEDVSKIACCVLNSSVFYLWFIVLSDCRHLNAREVDNFPIGIGEMSKEIISDLCNLENSLMADYERNKNRKESYYKTTGKVIYDEYFPKKSKPIIDEIDTVLAKHYGFTEEELDFIINYDIKYRMGEELGEE